METMANVERDTVKATMADDNGRSEQPRWAPRTVCEYQCVRPPAVPPHGPWTGLCTGASSQGTPNPQYSRNNSSPNPQTAAMNCVPSQRTAGMRAALFRRLARALRQGRKQTGACGSPAKAPRPRPCPAVEVGHVEDSPLKWGTRTYTRKYQTCTYTRVRTVCGHCALFEDTLQSL